LFPDLAITVSTVTDTGQNVAHDRLASLATIVYIPLDLPGALNRALDRIRPTAFVIMETELWPGLLAVLRRRGIPALLVNGRISDRSFQGYLRMRWFFCRLLAGIDLFAMQNELYSQRIIALGADPEKVRVMGNLKFDTRPAGRIPAWTDDLSHPVLIAGSTHPGEEELVLDAFDTLTGEFPGLSLIIAPRHPERFGQVGELIRSRGRSYRQRSELDNATSVKPDVGRHTLSEAGVSGQIILLDVMGELAAVYGAADIAIMGGSFIAHGGQNLLEPAFWGKPALCGPHMENFPFAEDFYREHAALRVDRSTLATTLRRLLASPQECAALGSRARKLYTEDAGAAERAAALLEPYLRRRA
jgi:3-deoxy-D-manno-octulosonic-acid transferase